MKAKPEKIVLIGLLLLAVFWGAIFLEACKSPSSPDEDEDEDKAKIVGCNKVSYKGVTYTITGCEQPGVASFDVTITQNLNTASFHITCSSGCISSAVPK